MEHKHWCGNCQIRVYVERHYDKRLSWEDCPYTCEYAAAMRASWQKPSSEEVYGKYTDKAGNLHWTGTKSGEHIIKAEEGE